MKKKCELCNSPAKLFCDSDQASLCWSCDSKVHIANFLVAKHQRTLLCNLCQSLTPWTASGPKLTSTASVCSNCAAYSACRDEIGNGPHTNSDGDDDSEDSEEDPSGGGGGDEDEENQVVPAPPAASSSSNSDQESCGLIESSSIGEIVFSLKSSSVFSQNLNPVSPLRRLAAHELQKKQEKEEEEERLMQKKARELDAFDQQNHGALPQYSDRNHSQDKTGFHGANSVKATSFEEEALKTMKAFWLPSATPEAPIKVEASSTSTTCPEGKEKLKMKTLFPIYLKEDTTEKKSSSLDKTYICPSCKVTLTNTMSLVAISTCGHVFCKKCAEKFMVADKVCLVCSKPCKERNLVNLEKGGTGFAGHGDNLVATDFKHLGSGSGLGLIRPSSMKT